VAGESGPLWRRQWPGLSRGVFVVLGSICIGAGLPILGFLGGTHSTDVLAVSGFILLLGVIVTDVRLFPLLSIPLTLVVRRVGSGSGLSTSDFVLFLGTLCALPLVRLRHAPELRRLLWILCFYQATTVLTLIYNPYKANFIEWVHEAMLVGGSLIVGWVVAESGRTKIAVSLYLFGACIIAVWAFIYSASHHFHAASLPWGMDKNYIGDMLAFAVVLAYARPAWIGWRSPRWTRAAILICLLGILGSEAKQAMISCAAGIAFMVIRDRDLRRRSKLILVALIPLLIIAYETVSHEVVSSNRYNSVYQRLSWFGDSIEIWHYSPLVGVGLRWFYTDRFPITFQPPNGVLEMLTSAGVIGLMGFVVLLVGSLVVLRTLPRHVGTIALAVLIVRFIQGELDLFWVGAQGSLPWMIAGLALGALAREQADSTRATEADWRPPLLADLEFVRPQTSGLP
jgi:hypothetical protein